MKEKICRDCGTSFILKQNELDFFIKHGLHEPARCVLCRKKNKIKKSGLGNAQQVPQSFRKDRKE